MTSLKADLKRKKILFIAYFYPPVSSTGVPGAMRTVKFIRNLNNGECHVLTCAPEMDEKASALNHLLLPINQEQIHRVQGWDIFKLLLKLRKYIKNIYRKCINKETKTLISNPAVFKSTTPSDKASASVFQNFKDFIYNLCYFPDQAGPWILPAYLKGKKLVREHNLDVIFATGSPWSGLLVGLLISKATGKPLLADFRDPWMNNPFHNSKGKLLDRWSKRLEKMVVTHASAISLNTEPLMKDFLERYPSLPAHHFFVLPNGFDMADFKGLTPEPANQGKGILTLCHAGFLYGVRDPAVLLNAIKSANAELAPHNKSIRFQQIGDVQLSYDIHTQYASMIKDGSLILDAPRPYQECLRALGDADWVVNVQPATKSQVPSKLYDYLAINRPILNITPEDGALGQLVIKHGLGKLFDFDDEKKITAALIDISLDEERNTFSGYTARSQFNSISIAEGLAQRIILVTAK